MPDLQKDDFEVFDNGKRQTLTVFSNEVQPITGCRAMFKPKLSPNGARSCCLNKPSELPRVQLE